MRILLACLEDPYMYLHLFNSADHCKYSIDGASLLLLLYRCTVCLQLTSALVYWGQCILYGERTEGSSFVKVLQAHLFEKQIEMEEVSLK